MSATSVHPALSDPRPTDMHQHQTARSFDASGTWTSQKHGADDDDGFANFMSFLRSPSRVDAEEPASTATGVLAAVAPPAKKEVKIADGTVAPRDGREDEPPPPRENHHHHHIHISIDRLDLKRIAYLGLFIFVVFPALSIAVATIFGGILAWAEGTSFRNGFLYVVSTLLGMGNPLTDYVPDSGAVVIVIDLYTAVAALVGFGIMLNVVNLFQVPDEMNKWIRKFVRGEFIVPVIALLVVIPAWNSGICVFFGCILALAEGWHVREGILYVLTNTLGLAIPLTDVVPSTFPGAMLDVVISSIVLGYMAIFADYVTTLNPSSYVRRKARAFLIKFGVIDNDRTTILHPLARHGHVDEDEEIGITIARSESPPGDEWRENS